MGGRDYIDGGYILLSRKLIESEIWAKPPLYLKVWIYILLKARHKATNKWERGELMISIPELQEACSYYAGYRKETPSKKQIFDILEWLRNPHEDPVTGTVDSPMMVTQKTTRGMVCKVLNYNVYQDPKNYERNYEGNSGGNDGGNNEVTAREHYTQECSKNGKNDKNDDDVEIFIKNFEKSTGKEACISEHHHQKIKDIIKAYGKDSAYKFIENINKSEYLKKNASIYWLLEEGKFERVISDSYKDFEEVERKKDKSHHLKGSRTSEYTEEELDRMASNKLNEFRERREDIREA